MVGALSLGACESAGPHRSPVKELPEDVPSYPECVYDERFADPDEVATASKMSVLELRDNVDGVFSGTITWEDGETARMQLTVRLLLEESKIRVPRTSSNPYCRSVLRPRGEVDLVIGDAAASELPFGYVMSDPYHFGGLPTIPRESVPAPLRESLGTDAETVFSVLFSMGVAGADEVKGDVGMYGAAGNGSIAEFELARQ